MSTRVIIGLGSNLGDRLQTLSQAVRAIGEDLLRDIRVASIYESEALLLPDSPEDWDIPFYNTALIGELQTSLPSLLAGLKNIEKRLGRKERSRWAPREIDLDILCAEGLKHSDDSLSVPHPGLAERPFALIPAFELLVDEGEEQRNYFFENLPAKSAELVTKAAAALLESFYPNTLQQDSGQGATLRANNHVQRKFRGLLEQQTGAGSASISRPEIMAVVNVTPDSFSDGGESFACEQALASIEVARKEGAHIADLGAEATGPTATAVPPEQEWRRLSEILEKLTELEKSPLVFSVDTRNASTAEKALGLGVSMVNDVSAAEDQEMLPLVAEAGCQYVFMHHLGIPTSRERHLEGDAPVRSQLEKWQEEKLKHFQRAGVQKEQLIFDPGIGFGKTAEQSWRLLRDASELSEFPVLIGHSRKSFLTLLGMQDPRERDLETALLSAKLLFAEYLRVHNVSMTRRALRAALRLRIA